jgi:hypothetical protein
MQSEYLNRSIHRSYICAKAVVLNQLFTQTNYAQPHLEDLASYQYAFNPYLKPNMHHPTFNDSNDNENKSFQTRQLGRKEGRTCNLSSKGKPISKEVFPEGCLPVSRQALESWLEAPDSSLMRLVFALSGERAVRGIKNREGWRKAIACVRESGLWLCYTVQSKTLSRAGRFDSFVVEAPVEMRKG